MTNDERLAEVIEDFTQRLRNGESPSIQEYCDKYPDLADEIRKVLPSLQAMEQLSSQEHSERKFEHKTKKLAFAPDGLIGDYKIIGEVGRGGMGVVYEAEEQSLQRRVALKILGPTLGSSEKQLARFRAEAKAVASLHHTNIVSVYGVGEHDGLYFYAMQFIDGMTLADAINITETRGQFVSVYGPAPQPAQDEEQGGSSDTGKSDGAATLESPTTPGLPASPVVNEINQGLHSSARWLEIARLGASVADALDYAHVKGVWHRDIKPSNLILDKQGVIWVTDFGLARHEDREAVTATGDIVGTLKYMAPEQFNGEFDGRSDTYSLGLTIYEMLTQRAAFTEKQQGKLVKLKTTTPPPEPRSIRADIPRDLETIVMKACAINPAHRYTRPAELAADLRRFMEDRPIQARRVTWRERAYRWAKRNPLPAALSLLSMLLLMSVFAVFAYLNIELRGAVERGRMQKELAETQRRNASARAIANRERGLHTTTTSDRGLVSVFQRMLPEPLVVELDAKQHITVGVLSNADLEDLVWRRDRGTKYHDKFAETSSGQEDAIRRLVRVGAISERIGDYTGAAHSYYQALEGFQTMLKFEPQNKVFPIEKVRLHSLLERLVARQDVGMWQPTRDKPVPRLMIDPQLGKDVPIGAATGVNLLKDDPGNILITWDGAKYEMVRCLHNKFLADRIRRREDQLIGGVKSDGQSYLEATIDNEEAKRELFGLLAPLASLEEPSPEQEVSLLQYRLMNARVQTDRAKILLLEADRKLNHPPLPDIDPPDEDRAQAAVELQRESIAHLANAASNLRELVGSDFSAALIEFMALTGNVRELVSSDAEERRTAYKLELAYLLCLADGPLLGIPESDAQEYLSLLATTMEQLAEKSLGAIQAKRIAGVANKLLDELK